ncbi:CHRD domain-containing protein [Candidatus Giovannonibacteria bacterium]|nr:CHRD domain-containing protein [Candidatus Giovannonibacteria bacterium]
MKSARVKDILIIGLIISVPLVSSAAIFDGGFGSIFGRLFDGGIFGRANPDILSVNLRGSDEVPPVSTNTSGRLILSFNPTHTAAAFRLDVFNGINVAEAHLHCAASGQNGPVIVFLFGKIPGGFDVNGTISSFTLNDDNILPEGATCSTPVTNMSTLFNAIRNGIIYANVHTVSHPAGEIRGQFASFAGGGTATSTLQIRNLFHGISGANFSRGVVVVRSQGEYDQLRNGISMATSSLPAVNFNNEIVLAVFQGTRATGGFDIQITNVEETLSFLRVMIRETVPGPRCVVTQALTAPFDVVSIQRVNKRVVIDHQVRETQCP